LHLVSVGMVLVGMDLVAPSLKIAAEISWMKDCVIIEVVEVIRRIEREIQIIRKLRFLNPQVGVVGERVAVCANLDSIDVILDSTY